MYVTRLVNITSGGVGDDGDESENGINQLFLRVDISKPGQKESLHLYTKMGLRFRLKFFLAHFSSQESDEP